MPLNTKFNFHQKNRNLKKKITNSSLPKNNLIHWEELDIYKMSPGLSVN